MLKLTRYALFDDRTLGRLVVDGEVFWGQDRLDMLDWRLSNL